MRKMIGMERRGRSRWGEEREEKNRKKEEEENRILGILGRKRRRGIDQRRKGR